jgi:hypothetical protein
LQPETHQKLALSPLPDQSREERLQAFVREHGTTIAAVRQAAAVAKPNMQQWRKEELHDSSVMSARIEAVLSGKRSMKR